MPLDVTAEDLAVLTGAEATDDTMAAVDRVVRTLIAGHYSEALDTAEGTALTLLRVVYTSAAVRLLVNPGGARTAALGGASVTCGGSDVALSAPFSLSAHEVALLSRLKPPRKLWQRLA